MSTAAHRQKAQGQVIEMRRISFNKTIEAFTTGKKTVTRRKGWRDLKVGQKLLAVDRVMGFKKGEKARELGVIQVVSVRREPLNAITADDVIAEGFPDWTPAEFVAFFCKFAKCDPRTEVTRIEFRLDTHANARRKGERAMSGELEDFRLYRLGQEAVVDELRGSLVSSPRKRTRNIVDRMLREMGRDPYEVPIEERDALADALADEIDSVLKHATEWL